MMIFLSDFINQIILLFTFHNLIHQKKHCSIFILLMILIISNIINVFLSHYQLNIISIIYNPLFFIFLIKYIYHLSFKQSFITVISVWIIAIIFDMFVMFLASSLIPNEYHNLMSLCSLIQELLIYITSSISVIRVKINKMIHYFTKLNNQYYLDYLLIIIYFYMDYTCLQNMKDNHITLFIIGSSLLLFILVLLIIYNHIQKKDYVLTEQYLSLNNTQMHQELLEYHFLKHNLINKLLGIESIANEETKLLINDIIKEYTNKKKVSITEYNVPTDINGLIFEIFNYYPIHKLNLYINNEMKENIFHKLGPHKYNLLCDALTISLNNAIESSLNSKTKILYLSFTENNDEILIVIENSYGNNIPFADMGLNKVTTKNHSHGYGILSLLNHRQIHLKYKIINQLFITEITIKKLSNKRVYLL